MRHIVVMDDGAPRRDPRRPAHRDVGRAGRRRSTRSTSTTGSPTSGKPRRSVTRPARPATRRACSTRTGRPGCTRTPALTSACLRALRARQRMLPVVPMFHANAWGLPYAALLAGASIDHARAGPLPAGPRLADRVGEGHLRRRGADDLDGHAAAARRTTTVSSLRTDHLRRLGGATRRCPRRWRATIGVPITQALGDDRDVAARLRCASCGPRSPSVRGREGRRCAPRRASPRPGSRCASSTPRPREMQPWDDKATGELRCAGRGSPSSTTAPTSRASSSPPTAGCAPATSRRSRPWVRPPGRPHEGPGQVRRRVDQLRRPRERDHGPPEGRRGRGHRGPAPEMVERPLACVVVKDGEDADPRGGPGLPARAAGRVAGARRRRRSSTRSPRPASANSPRRPCATSSPTTSCPPCSAGAAARRE